MTNDKKDKIRKHASIFRGLIIAYSLVFVTFLIVKFAKPELLSQVMTGYTFKWYYLSFLSLPISFYGVWYVLNLAPNRQLTKTNQVLGLLFFGIIGMWISFPWKNKLEKQIKRDEKRIKFE
ncbi:hypothetical protein JCM19294_1023 [Nonlabens tegetincola]|uniref:Uncharacterized protein n=1 Tax=Nonlabens tegetincola TaxID=323273 RepID=A0A090Q0V4_9FLAO|nr:hypothetical protein [Nonlabens tegetincola]GAK96714.1 hypothetical protein JCM19294_1023 [Nonlabens tegetincola]